MTIRAWLILAALALILAGGNVYLLYSLAGARSDLSATEGKVKTLSSQVEALRGFQTRVATDIQSLNKRSAAHEAQLSKALREHAAWADTPVPGPVADSLCQFARCRPR